MTNKTLTNLVLTGALALGGAGCLGTRHDEYHFSGKIGEEQIEFSESPNYYWNTLKVVKADGSTIAYEDNRGDDLKLDFICILPKENTTSCYYADSKNPAVKPIMEQAQKQFDDYLAKILEINTAPLRNP